MEALHTALALISEREKRLKLQWYHKIYDDVLKGLRLSSVPSIHGSLITLGNLPALRRSAFLVLFFLPSQYDPPPQGEMLRTTGDFMNSRFKEVCDHILKYREHKERILRRAATTILPRLASFSPDEVRHLHHTIPLQSGADQVFLSSNASSCFTISIPACRH